jgi:hypothetical protein
VARFEGRLRAPETHFLKLNIQVIKPIVNQEKGQLNFSSIRHRTGRVKIDASNFVLMRRSCGRVGVGRTHCASPLRAAQRGAKLIHLVA